MNMDGIGLWVGFNLLVIVLLVIDLTVFHRREHVVSIKEALIWSGVWIGLALVFNLGVYFWRGAETALEFFTGYLLEKSLSVDNLFVFVLVFSAFSVPTLYTSNGVNFNFSFLHKSGILGFTGSNCCEVHDDQNRIYPRRN